MAINEMEYMLFPHTILSEIEYRHLSIMLPRLSVLQVMRPPTLPDWLREMVTGWPAIIQQEQIEAIRMALKGYLDFASVHGENSVLSSLSLDQISRDFAESRFRIQTHLKKVDPDGPGSSEIALLEAAIFLEMARDLDEKEMELEASFEGIRGLEGEFREILGISDEEELTEAIETMVPPLRAEKAYLSFMLPRRIQCWLRLFFNRMPGTFPSLVTISEQVVEELFEPFRAEYDRAGKGLQLTRISLGSIPAVDDLPKAEFLNLLSNPEATDLLTAYWNCLDNLMASPRDPRNQAEFSPAADTLQDYLLNYRSELGLSDNTEMKIDLVFDGDMRWSNLGKYFGQAEGLASEYIVDPDDLIKIIVCR